ncbi:MAG TPA: phosphodiester glycosidase family protein [Candidatus Cybelea sp.]|nr:phosphodiester glycosidase family protein [Candidatus Cybelea sp.]
MSLVALIAALLPALLTPTAPFPRIVAQAPTIESVAPGVDYGDYQLLTADGPLSVHVIAVAPHRSDVREENVLSGDELVSRGETVGSMAKRTGAIAGINGDFFDIGNTNRPVNMVVRGGALLQLPYKRCVLAIARDGTPHISEFSFSGQMEIAQRTMPLDGIDEMPLGGAGLSLLTPFYGRVAPHDNVTLATLVPLGGMPPLTRYRVTGIADNLSPQPPGYYVAIGLNDYNSVGVPDVGSVIGVDGDLSPLGLASIATAIGGGAMILHDGAWYDDPDAPYREENARRVPVSGAAIAPDGRLFLIEVDGRQAELSIGLKRPEFSALMRALGAAEGLLFDGGGSSTMVVRRLGDPGAGVVNSPSDGKERPVADGLFVYSTAPAGPAVRLVARPGVVRAVPGAGVPLRVAAVDSANNVAGNGAAVQVSVAPASLGSYRDGTFFAAHQGIGRLALRSANLRGEVPVEVEARPARSRIEPPRPNVDQNGQVLLAAQAFDARGYPLQLPSFLSWSASSGSIDGRGSYRAGSNDAKISVRIGDTLATTRVTVGSHGVALPFAQSARFVTAPRGGGGDLTRNAGCGSCVQLRFSFSNGERAAYAKADIPLPDDTIGMEFDLSDDGSAARVRVAIRNEINEDVLLDATRLGNPGWRHVVVRFPADAQAMRLVSIYVLPSKGVQLSDGSIVLRNVRAIVAGH